VAPFYVPHVLPVNQPTVKALQETQSTDPNQPTSRLVSSFVHPSSEESSAGPSNASTFTYNTSETTNVLLRALVS